MFYGAKLLNTYTSGTVNSNTVNREFHLILNEIHILMHYKNYH